MAVRNFSIDITVSEREAFKKLAKSKGMTVQGLAGQLIKQEIARAEKQGFDFSPFPQPYTGGQI